MQLAPFVAPFVCGARASASAAHLGFEINKSSSSSSVALATKSAQASNRIQVVRTALTGARVAAHYVSGAGRLMLKTDVDRVEWREGEQAAHLRARSQSKRAQLFYSTFSLLGALIAGAWTRKCRCENNEQGRAEPEARQAPCCRWCCFGRAPCGDLHLSCVCLAEKECKWCVCVFGRLRSLRSNDRARSSSARRKPRGALGVVGAQRRALFIIANPSMANGVGQSKKGEKVFLLFARG